MKIYLDDIRFPKHPKGMTILRNYMDFMFTWECNKDVIDYISFDHDLGTGKTGYDALKIVEEDIMTGVIQRHIKLFVHSANPVGNEKMQKVIDNLDMFMIQYCQE